ncbi:response regulator transcription factor [Herbiconiux sp.]|uniref:LuxR C-terminal-related transcriptional regulator n=1 Tax=Herbiconiux sp. TaxID=1871186 RepID=UPI0025C5F938|nr:response regulator transcription factor [Herbiconiux sp.]
MDDHESVALGLREAFRGLREVDVVASASTVVELLAITGDLDIVILDLRLADGSSPVVNAERLAERGAKVIAYTSGEHPQLIRLAATSDVVALVRKSSPIEVLIETVDGVRRGAHLLSPELAAAIHSDPHIRSAGLSAQEVNVLQLFADGVKSQVVASELGIAAGTVDDYVRRIRVKYTAAGRPAHTKVDLYKRAVEDGLLPVPQA